MDTARERGFVGKYQERVGIEIITIAVLVILITAPIGAIAIAVAGPKFLRKERAPLTSIDGDDIEAGDSERTGFNIFNCLSK